MRAEVLFKLKNGNTLATGAHDIHDMPARVRGVTAESASITFHGFTSHLDRQLARELLDLVHECMVTGG